MRKTTQHYIDKINEPIRDTTQVQIELMTGDHPLFANLDNFELRGCYNNSGRSDTYYATYADNGFRLGDPNCVIRNELEDDNYEDRMCQYAVSDGNDITIVEQVFTDEYEITLDFADSIPSSIIVSSYAIDGTLLGSKTYPVEEGVFTIDISNVPKEAESYYSIAVRGTPIGSRLKIALFVNGLYYSFTNENITSVRHLQTTDLISATIPTNKIIFNVYDREGNFNPANPNGKYKYFSRGNKVIVKYGYLGEMIDHSHNYLVDMPEWDNGILTLSAVSWLELSKNKYFVGGYGIKGDGKSPAQYRIKEHVGIDWDADIEDVYSEAVISDLSFKEVAQIAGNATVSFLVPNDKRVRARSTETAMIAEPVDFHLKPYDMVTYPKVSLSPGLSQIVYHPLNVTSDDGTEYDLPTITLESNKPFRVDLPEEFLSTLHYGFTPNLPSGVTVTSSRSNEFFTLIFTSQNTITLSGIKVKLYRPTTTQTKVTKVISKNGEEMPIDNPFITIATNIDKHSNKVKEIYSHRQLFDIKCSQDFRLELGDVIKVDTQYENNVYIIITEIEYTLPGRFGVLKGRRLYDY